MYFAISCSAALQTPSMVWFGCHNLDNGNLHQINSWAILEGDFSKFSAARAERKREGISVCGGGGAEISKDFIHSCAEHFYFLVVPSRDQGGSGGPSRTPLPCHPARYNHSKWSMDAFPALGSAVQGEVPLGLCPAPHYPKLKSVAGLPPDHPFAHFLMIWRPIFPVSPGKASFLYSPLKSMALCHNSTRIHHKKL